MSYRENPDLYLEQLHTKHKELSDRLDQRKRQKTNGNQSNGNNGIQGGIGRGERLSAAQKERMRLLTTAAYDRGKGEDTFGAKDEDWQLYKLMSKDNDDEDDVQDPEEAELTRISARLRVSFKLARFHVRFSLITISSFVLISKTAFVHRRKSIQHLLPIQNQ